MLRATNSILVRYATTITVLAVTLVMILSSIVFYKQGRASNVAKRWVVHTYEVTGHIQLLFNRIKDVELGQRGYIISGQEEYLAPYFDALKNSLGSDAESDRMEQHHSIAEELKILRKITYDSPAQQQNLDEMDSDIRELLTYWAATTQMKPDAHHKVAAPKAYIRKEYEVMERLRSLVGIMMAQENNLLEKRIKDDETSTHKDNVFTFSGIGLFYFAMLLSIWLYHNIKSRSQAELRHYTQELEKSEAQLRGHQVELKGLVSKLTESNTELEHFAYVASHDMQEPLRMVASFSELLREEYGAKLDETGNEYLHVLIDAATRMQSMVNDLLEYARLGNDTRRFVTVDANEELRHVLKNLSAAITEHHAHVTHDALPAFDGNPVQFVRLLQNLIGNGLKYQVDGHRPAIHIAFKDEDKYWRFSVQDNGIGINEEFVNQVFEPFKRLHSWEEYKGTGIGLAVCKKIVESHGGKIWATSTPGSGSTFYFTIAKSKNRIDNKESL